MFSTVANPSEEKIAYTTASKVVLKAGCFHATFFTIKYLPNSSARPTIRNASIAI